ncbi:MAG: alpha/beta fold hydrolase [Promethearchaeati archaeon]
MAKDKDRRIKEKYNIETGYFEDGLPYARMGNNNEIIIDIEALSFTHRPPSGMVLKQFAKSAQSFIDQFTYYLVGRKPNLPEGYLFDKMAEDYAKLIRREFKKPVTIMGTSTGGQIAQYIAADHPDVVKNLVIISAAYRLSEKGVEVEGKSAEYFQQGKYGKSLSTIIDLMFKSRFLKILIKPFLRLLGKKFMGDIEYPNDFLNEVRGDREMNFIDKLKDIKATTLILSGEDDIGYTAEDVKKTAEGIPNAKLILYEKFGHNLVMRNRKQVVEDILEFLTT